MEHALRNKLLPFFLVTDGVDVDIKFHELLALAVKKSGLGIHNSMVTAEDYYNTSLNACGYLVDTLVTQEQLDQVWHVAHIADAVHSAQQV